MTKVANAAVLNSEQSDRGKRKYTYYTDGQRTKIAKYAGIWLPSGTSRMNFRPLVRAQRGSLRSNILPQGNSTEGMGVDCGGGASATLSSHLFNSFTSNCFYHICLTAQSFPELRYESR